MHIVECPRRHRATKKREADSHSVPIDFHGAGQDRSEVFWACYTSIGGNSPSSERRRESRGASRRCRRSGGFGAAAADVGVTTCAVTSISLCLTHGILDSTKCLSRFLSPCGGRRTIGGMNPIRSRARQLRRNQPMSSGTYGGGFVSGKWMVTNFAANSRWGITSSISCAWKNDSSLKWTADSTAPSTSRC